MTLRPSGRLAAILMLAALPACAADQPPPPAPMQMTQHMGPMHHQHRHGAMMGPERIEGRLAFLKTELKITDAQLPQWNTFAAALRAQAKDASAHRAERHAAHHQPGEQREAKPLPERMAAMERMMQAHLQRLQQMRSTVEPLYGVLSPEQRKTADTLLMRG